MQMCALQVVRDFVSDRELPYAVAVIAAVITAAAVAGVLCALRC